MPRQSRAHRFATSAVALPLPTIVVVVLSLIAGAVQVVNQVVLKGNPQIQGVIAVFLVFLVAIGIHPATGSAFRDLLKLPAWAYTLITAGIMAATGALQIVGLSVTAHAIIATVLTVLAALGFATTSSPISAPDPVPVPPKLGRRHS